MTCVLPIVALKKKDFTVLAPITPLCLAWLYQYDLYYGNLQMRAQAEASRMLKEEPERFFLPKGSLICEQAEYNEIVGLPADYKPTMVAEMPR